ncbi:uncharacterized protein GGS22DRAFT_176810 [Annulohypoxylon maeteangense]|uniref:uncharacterized protein n=1 Tax=Annulohypoxylon maeteangense TaxID=1927788 RepID=UPI00200750A9|nr:uncharacterized protein GGS22DRAFT_176810 [Annulohypoxylon maeteangense]KAI0889499.1 hypothetical protein GGS22DRAFT_176810 [Annulohypoxylon maeteangense]
MPGLNDSCDRGAKRKYTGELATIAYNHLTSAMVPGCLASRDDHYYKNLYLEEPDFFLLGQRDPEFRTVLERGSYLDFANPKSVMQLTKTLLKLDFGLLVDLPTDRLCPPVPNRHNYILWLKDLIDSSCPLSLDSNEPARKVTGLDVGTGASLIYPLLGCVQRPSWSFIATDVDSKSLAYARNNAQLNSMSPRIRVVNRNITDCLIPLVEFGLESIDFVMVNPPFYTSKTELEDLASQKSRPPNSACTGAPIEMVCAGGEVGFVRRIIDESLVLREKVQWYTAMLGKQSSLEVLISILKTHGVTNYAVNAFVQGKKTRRWAIGWSFHSRRPSLSASRGCEPSAGKKILPLPTEATVASWPVSRVKPEKLEQIVCDTMENIDVASWIWDRSHFRGIGFSDGNVWGRAYRRKRAREKEKGEICSKGEETTEINSPDSQQMKLHCGTTEHGFAYCSFGFSITIRVSRDVKTSEDESVVVAHWLKGNDYALFESFTGLLRKSIRLE